MASIQINASLIVGSPCTLQLSSSSCQSVEALRGSSQNDLVARFNARTSRCRSSSRKAALVVCAATAGADAIPTVADTKAVFLNKYRRPIPSLYNSVLQELLVQQHFIRYNSTYNYDSIFALGFVTVFDQLMDGFPVAADRDRIFAAYIEALNENPEAYRKDAVNMEEWARTLDLSAKETSKETMFKDIVEKAGGKSESNFHYSRFFAVGLFRILELANASDPATLSQLCEVLKVDKMSVDRDLDVYRGLLNKLTQAKGLLADFLEREKVKQAEREKEKAEKEKANVKAE